MRRSETRQAISPPDAFTMQAMDFDLRLADMSDVPSLELLITESARELSQGDYTELQIETALGTAWGVDSELIRDGTYFVAVAQNQIVACGGWSFRKTLFGADAHSERQSELLDPATQPARIRAFFVHPTWTRKGIAGAILDKCESAAKEHGFHSVALVATLSGRRFYVTRGFEGDEPATFNLAHGITIEFVPMTKRLVAD